MFFSAEQTRADRPIVTVNDPCVCAASHIPTVAVGPRLHDGLSDAELEIHIAAMGERMLEAYARYEATGCLGDRGEADGWRLLMQDAIGARRPAVVAGMERARGIASAQ